MPCQRMYIHPQRIFPRKRREERGKRNEGGKGRSKAAVESDSRTVSERQLYAVQWAIQRYTTTVGVCTFYQDISSQDTSSQDTCRIPLWHSLPMEADSKASDKPMLHQKVQVLVQTCVCSPWQYCKALGSEITIFTAFPCHTVVESQHAGFRNTSHYIGVCLTLTLSSNPLIKPPLSSQDSLLLHYQGVGR